MLLSILSVLRGHVFTVKNYRYNVFLTCAYYTYRLWRVENIKVIFMYLNTYMRVLIVPNNCIVV